MNHKKIPPFKIHRPPVFKTRLAKDPPTCAQKIKVIQQMALTDSVLSTKGTIEFPLYWALECPEEFSTLNHHQNYTVQRNLAHWYIPKITNYQTNTRFHLPQFSTFTKRTITVEMAKDK